MTLYDLASKYYKRRRGWRAILNIVPFRNYSLLRKVAAGVGETVDTVEIALMVVIVIAKKNGSKELTDQEIFEQYDGTFAAFLLMCSGAYWGIPLTRP